MKGTCHSSPSGDPRGRLKSSLSTVATITMTVKGPGIVLRLPALFHFILATPTTRELPLSSPLHREETEAHRGKYLAQGHSTEQWLS